MSGSANNSFEYLIDSYEKKSRQLQEAMAAGAYTEYAGYREAVGIIKGLRFAIDEVRELRKRIEQA